MLDIHGVMTALSKTRPIFHSEGDFQHELACQIHKMMPDSRIRLEFPLKEGTNLDIWLANEKIAIELKYKIKGDYKSKRLLARFKHELFILSESGAQNHSRYLFLRDVKKVESAERGFAIILTNEPAYWNPGPVSDKTPDDDEFRIHEGRELSGVRNWKDPKSKAAKRYPNPINLSGSYTLHWQDYSDIPALPPAVQNQGRHRQFRYLVVTVGN